MKKILRSTYYTLVVAVFLLIALVGLTQTKTFRNYIRTLVIVRLQSMMSGDIEMGTIGGNLGTGFHIDNVGLRKDGREIFFTERLEARYDPLGFLVRRVPLSRITLLRPRIHVWRSTDGSWNVDRILAEGGEADTTPSSWVLDVSQIELLGATVSVVDSLALEKRVAEEWERYPAMAFDYADVQLSPLTLRASLKIDGDKTNIVINSLEFESIRPSFKLEHLAGEISLHPRFTEVRKLLVRAAGVSLTLDARMEDANPFSIKDLRDIKNAPTTLNLSVDQIDFNTFKRFLPGPVDFLDKQASLTVKARGKFGQLRVDEVQVRTGRSFVQIAGTIENLHHPQDLVLDLHAKDNILHPADAADLLPGLRLPDLSPVGVLSCDFSFKGRPDHFAASLSGEIPAGQFGIEGDLDLRRPLMIYKGSVTTQNFNLADLFRSEDISSNLNVKGTFSGSGTHMRDLTAILRIQADSSTLFDQPVDNSVLVMDIADRSLRSNLLFNAGQTRFDLNGRTTFRNDDSTTYTFTGKIFSLNLADILRRRSYESDLSVDMKSQGIAYGFTPVRSKTDVLFLRSTFGAEQFENTPVTIEYDGEDSLQTTLVVTSDPVDVTVRGVFSPANLIKTIEGGGRILSEALSHRFAALDSLRSAPAGVRSPYRTTVRPSAEPVNADLSVHMRDFHPLGVFLGEHLVGSSALDLHIDGTLKDLHLSGNLLVDRFGLGTSGKLRITNGKSSFRMGHLGVLKTLESLESDIEFTAQQMMYDSVSFSDAHLTHTLSNDSSRYSVGVLVDSTVGVHIEGTSRFVPNLIALNIATLQVAVADYEFGNTDPLDLVLGRDGIRVGNLSMQHEAETVTFNGILDPSGYSDLQFSVENFLVRNLRNFSRKASYIEKVRDFNGILDASGSFKGNFKVPQFDVTLLARGVTVGSTLFGQVSGRGSYTDGISNIFLEFLSNPGERNAQPELLVSGTMPIKLGSVRPAHSAQGMDLLIQSRGFRLEFLDPFLPITHDLRGSVEADLRMKGTLSEPLYEGSLSIRSANFYFTPLGIAYNLSGILLPQQNKITFKDLMLSNIEDDRVPGLIDGLGSMNIDGSLSLEGLEVKEFYLVANGQLLVMKESSRLENLPVYGNIYVSSGSNPIRWSGTPDRSSLTGDVLLKNANITFPPSREVVLERSRLFTVNFVDDTTAATGPGRPARGTVVVASNDNGSEPIPPAPGLNSSTSSTPGEDSFLDNIVYNLTVEAAGLTQVRFVFNQLTNEELFADLKGRLVFTKNQSASRLTGELQVGPRSYYKYFKTLQATGKLLFTGDVANPELDIVATYEGTHQPDTTRVDLTEQQKQEEKVVVRLTITGTRAEPKVKMGLEVYDRDGNKLEDRPDAQSDAIAFLVSGRFKEEMTQRQETSLTTNLLSSIGSSLLSGPLTDFVRSQVGYITSVDVVYAGGVNRSFEQSADLRITGEVGDAVIRLGGRVFSNIANANVSVQFPMSSVVGSEAWRDLILELERRVEGVESIEQRRPSNGLRLLYRITF